jgi:3'-5' exoribonuclease
MGPRLPGDKGPQARPKEKSLTHNPFAALAAKLEGGTEGPERPMEPAPESASETHAETAPVETSPVETAARQPEAPVERAPESAPETAAAPPAPEAPESSGDGGEPKPS